MVVSNSKLILEYYEYYKNGVMWSSNPYDRHILFSEPIKGYPGMSSFKIGENFSQEEFIEKWKTDKDFAGRWSKILTKDV